MEALSACCRDGVGAGPNASSCHMSDCAIQPYNNSRDFNLGLHRAIVCALQKGVHPARMVNAWAAGLPSSVLGPGIFPPLCCSGYGSQPFYFSVPQP